MTSPFDFLPPDAPPGIEKRNPGAVSVAPPSLNEVNKRFEATKPTVNKVQSVDIPANEPIMNAPQAPAVDESWSPLNWFGGVKDYVGDYLESFAAPAPSRSISNDNPDQAIIDALEADVTDTGTPTTLDNKINTGIESSFDQGQQVIEPMMPNDTPQERIDNVANTAGRDYGQPKQVVTQPNKAATTPKTSPVVASSGEANDGSVKTGKPQGADGNTADGQVPPENVSPSGRTRPRQRSQASKDMSDFGDMVAAQSEGFNFQDAIEKGFGRQPEQLSSFRGSSAPAPNSSMPIIKGGGGFLGGLF